MDIQGIRKTVAGKLRIPTYIHTYIIHTYIHTACEKNNQGQAQTLRFEGRMWRKKPFMNLLMEQMSGKVIIRNAFQLVKF